MEVIVVDNASRKDEATMIEQKYPFVKVIRSHQNLGFAGGNNLGIKAARGQYLYLINNDTELKADSNIDALIRRLDSDETIGMVCPKIRFAWANQPIQFAGYTPLSKITMRNRSIGYGEADYGQYSTPHPTPYAHGAAMLVKRKVVEEVGLIPECYFLYYEELDWSMMLRQRGYSIWYEPAGTIYHKESQSTGQNSPLKTYYITRNRFIFAKRNLPRATKYLTYSYLMAFVAIRDLIKYAIMRRTDLAKSTLAGIRDFFSGRWNNRIQK